MTIGHKLGLRLFLEGIEVPVIAAQISIVADSPAAATIQVIATDAVMDLLPRTMVHLFFYDFVDATSPITDDGGPTGATNPAYYEYERYKLLFMGELHGLTFAKDSQNRSVTLSCVDFSNYWDTTYQYNFQGSLIGGRREAAFIGANANYFTSPLGHGTGAISRLLDSKSVNFPEMTGLLAGIIRTLEAIGGAYYKGNSFRGANDFTSIAELRCKILQQICAAEKDTSTARLFRRKTFNMWMNREIGSLGKLVTFRGLTQLMQSFIYHEVYPCPAAMFVSTPKDDQGNPLGITRTSVVSTDLGNSTDPATKDFKDKIYEISKLNDITLQAMTGAYSQAFGSSSLDLNVIMANIPQEQKLLKDISAIPTMPGADLQAEINKIDAAFKEVDKWIGRPTNTFVLDVDRFFKSPNYGNARLKIEQISSICGTILGKRLTRSKKTTYYPKARVNNQLFRPDVWHAPAPRCNVIFPEIYSTMQWTRNFLREVSRLELQCTNEVLGSDAIFNGRYYSPNVADMRKGLKLSSRKFFGLIMQHELLTGIIPMYEKMTQANLYSMKAAGVNKTTKVPYAQRAVNHQYFKYRFAARQMSVTGRFNPWFVPGFPAVVIDRPMSADKLEIASRPLDKMQVWWTQEHNLSSDTKKKDLPTRSEIMRDLVSPQYVGTCVQLSHSVTQQGGNTSYVMAQARVHRESAEYLGVDKVELSEVTGRSSRTYSVSALPNSAPTVGSKGLYGGKITSVTDTTDSNAGKGIRYYAWPPTTDNVEHAIGDSLEVTGKTLYVGMALDYEEFASNNPLASDQTVVPAARPFPELGKVHWNSYEITEVIEQRRTKPIDLPIEEAVKPPWIWDGWTNLKIGDTYLQFFGSNSITDVEGVISKSAVGSMLASVEEEQALYTVKEGFETGSGQGLQKTPIGFVGRTKEPPPRKRRPKQNRMPQPKVDVTPSQDIGDQKLTAGIAYILNTARTIEASIDFLVRLYSLVKTSGLDVGLFIRNYTWRPIATMTQILGSPDLSILPDEKGMAVVKSGVEGFHSRAFGNIADLFGLVDPKVKKVLGLSDAKDHATAKRLDMRQKRWLAVNKYAEELMQSKGLLG